MVKWKYVEDVKKEKADPLIKDLNKKFPDRVYGIGICRSNNPGMVGIYSRKKDQEEKK
jgi:hypothetical protein